MANEVTIIVDGTPEVISQENIQSPKYECGGCMEPWEYVKRIGEYGLTTVTNNGDGTYSYRHINGHCICEVLFTEEC